MNHLSLQIGKLHHVRVSDPDFSHPGAGKIQESGRAQPSRADHQGPGVKELPLTLAADLGVRDRVFFAGSVSDDDLPAIYRSCDLSMLISDRGKDRGEGIPLTPLEAAACGLPILVGDQDGSQEAVEDGVNGWRMDPFDLASQRAAVERLVRDRELRLRMGRAARQRILREHSFDVFVQRTRTVLDRLQVASRS
jgi:phosphatidylinositol alpha-1,6-mannosyltransferase